MVVYKNPSIYWGGQLVWYFVFNLWVCVEVLTVKENTLEICNIFGDKSCLWVYKDKVFDKHLT